jgi:shikimate dehydrogenase
MRLFGLIGYPLGHSFSKKYFAEKFLSEGIKECNYELFPIEQIEQLPTLLQQHPNLKGLNVTIPYKIQVLPFLTESCIPQGLEACNCIKISNAKLTGYNTDVVGFEKSFTKQLQPHHTKALLLGNGGATAAVTYTLKQLGIEFSIVSRQPRPDSNLTYEQLTPALIAQTPIIINCSPVGTYPKINECPPLHYNKITHQHYLFDLVYNPAKTLFLQKGEEMGAKIQNGYDMLVGQAEEAWRIWNS